ncbi:MAG: transglycosylase domain-containing protein [Cellulomonadaceae bacterium]|jgi:membrane peptidoglycan carboxypeptidase|nr:transglycosylase domain-containing protein [Cellulomonadaceae bacterium]
MLATAGGVAAVGLVLPAALNIHAIADSSFTALTDVPVGLERRELSQASSIYAANGTLLTTFFAQNRSVVPLEDISQHMINAVIAIEDERFEEHNGVDFRSVVRAVVNNLRGGTTQGASTITMQYVKNRLIDASYHEGDPFGVIDAQASSLARKAREAALAIELERTLSKDEILEGYLNLAQFGRNNIFGVENAAQFFFSKSAADLTAVEAATIAGITNAPSRFDPITNPEASQARRNLVLFNMHRNGFLTTDEWNVARSQPIHDTLNINPVPHGCQAAGDVAFFCDYVISVIRTSPEFGATEAARLDLLNRGGLSIVTTIDLDIQAAAVEQVNAHVPNQNTANLDAALVAVQPGTGRILAMAQNAEFDARPTPEPGSTAINFSAGIATGSRGFQIGSTVKPIVLAEWLKSPQNNLTTPINSASISPISQNNWAAPCVGGFRGGDPWWPGNALNQRFGHMNAVRAMYLSVNTAFARMSTQIDLCDLRDTMWLTGFHPSISEAMSPSVAAGDIAAGTPLQNPQPQDIPVIPSMVLGAQSMTPLQIASAYATFASGGTYCNPIAISEVRDSNGRTMNIPQANCIENALPREVADQVSYTLQRSMGAGTGRTAALADGRESAGKTGTTNRSNHTWFIGYTAQMATAALVGNHSGNVEHFNIMFEGRRISTLFGSTIAAPMWRDFMNQAHEDMPLLALFRPYENGLAGVDEIDMFSDMVLGDQNTANLETEEDTDA